MSRRPLAVVLGLWGLGCEEPVGLSPADRAAFQAVHAAIYGGPSPAAGPGARYDHLAASFSGDALTDAFLAQRRLDRRLSAEQTALWVEELRYDRVEQVPLDAADALVENGVEPADLAVEAEWRVSGVVEHAGHQHARTNRYRARYGLRRTAAGLRIVSSRLRGQEQVPGGPGGEAWGPDGRPRAAKAPVDPFTLLPGAPPGAEPAR